MKRKFLNIMCIVMLPVFGSPSCSAETLPETDFDACDPVVKQSEIQRVFLAKVGAASFNDWTQPEEWNERVSETDTGIDAIRPMTVIGDKPAPAATKKAISGGRNMTTRKDHTLNVTVDEVTDANHAFLQAVETGKRFKMWYETAGGYMFGGNNGILIEISGDMILPRGQGEVATYQYVITWASPTTEQRCLSPIFGETLLGTISYDTTILFATDSTPDKGASDFVLAGGTNATAKFQYNDINPTIGAAITMTIKVATVLKLTMNTTADFVGSPFIFTDNAGVEHQGLIASGDVNF